MPKEDVTISRMLKMSMLLDMYGSLLTDKQRQFMKLHYERDMSFGEIAGEFDVSRQAIHDSVKHAERVLENLEEKLGLVRQAFAMDERRRAAERLLDLKQKIQQQWIVYNTDWIVDELTEIIERLAGRGEAVDKSVENADDAEELVG